MKKGITEYQSSCYIPILHPCASMIQLSTNNLFSINSNKNLST